ncbi:MAG: DUF4003 family protein [Lachnospiraceae bacterium]|nr:DUF4003 family protein [Lachnospiraceae bacterium]
MRESLTTKCERFIRNRDVIKANFKWDSVYIVPVCASELTGKNIEADSERLLQCKKLVDENTGVFSSFRGNVKLPIITKLAQDDYPAQKLENTKKIYEILKKYFWGSQYLTLVATILADMVYVDEADRYAARGKRIYELMKKEHPFLTSGEDGVFAVLMAFSEKEDSELIADMEACYDILKGQFSSSNSVQSLSHVLALSEGTPEEKCKKVFTLNQELKNAGRKYGTYYELAVLGAVSLVSDDMKALAEDMLSVDSFLANQKGYGFFGIDKKTRLMHAAMLVAGDYSKESNTGTAAITGTLAMIAAQQAAMCAVIASSAAASSASN